MGGSDEDLIRQIHEARKVSAKGVILFDYAHLSDRYIATLSKGVFSKKSPFVQASQVHKQTTKTEIKINAGQKVSDEIREQHKGWWKFTKD